jgi:hypothetical protein
MAAIQDAVRLATEKRTKPFKIDDHYFFIKKDGGRLRLTRSHSQVRRGLIGATPLPWQLVRLNPPGSGLGRCQSAAGFRILIAVTANPFVAKSVAKRLLPRIGDLGRDINAEFIDS